MQQSNLPAVTGTIKSLQTLLKEQEKQFAMVLPKTLGIDRFIRIAISTVVQNSKLLECDKKTFLRSLLVLASLGLEPGGPLGHAHLVPFWNSGENRLDCQPIIDYKGYVALAHNSKEVGRITAHIIYENEQWSFSEGDVILHKPLPPSERGEKKIMVYAKAFDRTGILIAQEYLWAEEVEAIKKKSLGNKKNVAGSPWVTNEEAMWRKSPVRRMAKWMPMSSEKMQLAARIEEAQEEGFDINLDLSDGGTPPPASDAEQKTGEKTNALKERLTQARDQIGVRDQSKTGAPAGSVETAGPEQGVKGADATPGPPAGNPGEIVDAEFEGDPGPSDPEDYGDQKGALSNPVIEGASKDRAPTDAAPTGPPPPLEGPNRPTVVHHFQGNKGKEPETIGPSKGPRIERGRKAESYWLNESQIKCPPGGEKAGLITTKAWCDGHCQYRKRCFVFKD